MLKLFKRNCFLAVSNWTICTQGHFVKLLWPLVIIVVCRCRDWDWQWRKSVFTRVRHFSQESGNLSLL